MSYILEGLKKLEQKRKQQEIAPQSISFHTQEHTQDLENSSRRPLWFGIVAAALVLNAVIMYLFFQRTVDTKLSTTPSKTATSNDVPSNNSAVPHGTPASIGTVSTVTVKPKTVTPVPQTGTPPVQSDRIAPKEEVKPKQTPIANAERIERKPAPSARPVRLSELPEEIRKVLPAFKVSAHFFSPEPKSRFVRVNDKILHEGENLSEGLKVEEINSSGTMFNYQGHRFLLGIDQNQ